MAEENLEGKLKGYNKSVAIGQLGGLAATAAGVMNAEKVAPYLGLEGLMNKSYNFLGYNLAPGLPVLGAVTNFIGDQIGFAASLYAQNRQRYKGIAGKFKFIKDGFELGVRHLGSYFVSYPLAIAASTALAATGIVTGGVATVIPYIVESIITGLGYMTSTKGYRKQMAANPS